MRNIIMKVGLYFIIFSFVMFAFLLLLSKGVFSLKSCEFVNTCDYVSVLRVQNDTGGYDNAHAQNISMNTYNYTLCCKSDYTLLNKCGTVILRLSNETNAHVQVGNYSGVNSSNYTVNVCLSSNAGTIKCIYGNDCGSYICLASIASDNSSLNNESDAHIGSCDEYDKKICCKFIPKPKSKVSRVTRGGAGGGISMPATSKVYVFRSLKANEPVEIVSEIEEFPIRRFVLVPRKDLEDVSIIVRRQKPAGVKGITGAYAYFDFKKKNIDNEDIKKVEFDFKVSKNWLFSNRLSKDRVYLMHFKDGKWKRLKTKLIASDALYYYYRVETDSLDVYAVNVVRGTLLERIKKAVFKEKEEERKEGVKKEEEVGEEEWQERLVMGGESVINNFVRSISSNLVDIVVVVVVLFVVVIIIRKLRK